MISSIYKKSFSVLASKPLRLWGISLLSIFLSMAAHILFGVIPGAAIAIGLLLETSMTLIYLNGFLGQEVKTLQLFDCFRSWRTIGRVLGGMAWMLMWVLLWSLIPVAGIVFGVIKFYSYRLTPYILMKEPEVKATEAYKLSEQRTMGYKGKMFWADVLPVLAYIAAVLILSAFSAIPYLGWLFALVLAVLVVAFAVFLPLFLGLVQSAFYVEIQKSLDSPAAGMGWYE